VQIRNTRAIELARRKHPQAGAWLDAWLQITTEADWHSIVDLRKSFPSADGVKLDSGVVVTVFNVSGNKYRLLTTISYRLQLVAVAGLLTHAEYDKGKWKDQL
jgi:mRNA interferase HigB